jgi:hypothetical protein
MAGTQINFDDPSTWPQNYDIDGLAALAESSEDESTEEDTEKAVPQAAKAEAKAEEETPEEANKQEAQASQEQAKDEPQGGQETADLSADEAGGVYAKDGKHILPFKVVEELRRQNRKLNEQLAQIQAQTAQSTQEQAPQTATAGPPEDEDADPLEMSDADLDLDGEALQARLEKIEAEYGRSHRSQWLRLRENSRILRDMQWREQQVTAETVQEAINSNPILLAWQTDKDRPEWYHRAVRLHDDMIKNEPDYQALSLEQQMETLVTRIEAAFGESPHRAQIKPVEGQSQPPAPPKAAPQTAPPKEEKVGDLPIPTSMSSIPGGAPPDLGLAETFEKMTPQQIQAHFDKLAATNPAKFQEELSSL